MYRAQSPVCYLQDFSGELDLFDSHQDTSVVTQSVEVRPLERLRAYNIIDYKLWSLTSKDTILVVNSKIQACA